MLNNKIIWVASYPKSGNTWVRFLLANLLCGQIKTSENIEHIIPDIHKPLVNKKIYQFNDVIFLKTHWKYEKVESLKINTIGAIYIIRNPLDIIVSHLNYFRISDNVIEKNSFIEQFVNSCGAPQWINFQMGTWIENIESWAYRKNKFPCLIIRYEDLKTNPYVVVLNICNFLNLHKTETEVNQAIEQSSFQNLCVMEKQELKNSTNGFFLSEHQSMNDKEFRFMHKGVVGTFRQVLTKEQIKRSIDKFGGIMKKLGYTTEYSILEKQ